MLFYAAQTISKLMNTEDVAVYTVANQSYARLFSFTSPTARKLEIPSATRRWKRCIQI
ncbi:MAG: hypothetical protein ACLRIL_08460 [Fusicatenibacter saccharivorans]